MKAIMMSIRPQWIAKILNGEKTIEIRKRFPKDYVGWVYIYCTQDKDFLCRIDNEWNTIRVIRGAKFKSAFAGKVVARFWCDKVEYCEDTTILNDDDYDLECSCLTAKEIQNYSKKVYAIHITKLEIFDKPKEISEFKTRHYPQFAELVKNTIHYELLPLTRAPESWQFIEI